MTLDSYLLSSGYVSDISLESLLSNCMSLSSKVREFLLKMYIFENCPHVICI